jgi:hypothetical protein
MSGCAQTILSKQLGDRGAWSLSCRSCSSCSHCNLCRPKDDERQLARSTLQALSSPDFNNALPVLLATHPQGPRALSSPPPPPTSTSTSTTTSNSTPSAVQVTPLTRKSLSPLSHAAQQPLLPASICPALPYPAMAVLSILDSLPLLSCPIFGVSSLSGRPLSCCSAHAPRSLGSSCPLPLLLFLPKACLAVPVDPAPSACPVSLSVWRCLSVPAVVPSLGQSWWRWLL